MDAERANRILEILEATEANLSKLERIWGQLAAQIPEGMALGNDPEYENLRRQFADIVAAMPELSGFVLTDSTMSLNEIGQSRFDAREIGELEAHVSVEEAVEKPGVDLAEYRFRLRKKRRVLVGDLVKEIAREFDATLSSLQSKRRPIDDVGATAPTDEIDQLMSLIAQVDRLLGSLAPRPLRWSDLRRHLAFGQWGDVTDIAKLDWPAVRPGILAGLYGENDPVPVDVASLDSLEVIPPHTSVPTALNFSVLSPEDFERLLFALVGGEAGYENPQWLMRTNAPDRGRDVSVERVIVDGLAGTRRERVIVQCKHWQAASVGVAEFVTLREQVHSWEPPRVSVLVIATTGRFSADAVAAIERHNVDGSLPRVEMWPDSHLELLLARRPALVAEFMLRSSAGTG